MSDGVVEDLVKSVVEGIKYFGKAKKKVSPQMEKMEKAVETPAPPPTPPPVFPFTEPEKQSALRKRSVAGSKPFTNAEIKQGYRKL